MASKKKKPVPGSVASLTVPGENAQVSIASMSAFQSADDYKAPQGAIVKSMSPLLKPANFPLGKVLVGVFTKIFETRPAEGKVGEGVEIVPAGSPVGIALPVVATLRTGLELTGAGKQASSPHLGSTVAIKLMPERIPSKKGQDAWNFVVIIYPKTAST